MFDNEEEADCTTPITARWSGRSVSISTPIVSASASIESPAEAARLLTEALDENDFDDLEKPGLDPEDMGNAGRGDVLFIHDLMISEECRLMGLGQQAVRLLEIGAKKRGVTLAAVWASTIDNDAGPSYPFWESIGYTAVYGPYTDGSAAMIKSLVKRRNSDRDIRDLERRGGDDDYAQARLLREKVRAGFITHEQLVMAARLGHEVARLATPEWENQKPIDWEWYLDARNAIEQLQDGRHIVSYVVDCSERSLFAFEDRHTSKEPRNCIDAIRAWVKSPSPKNEQAAIASRFEQMGNIFNHHDPTYRVCSSVLNALDAMEFCREMYHDIEMQASCAHRSVRDASTAIYYETSDDERLAEEHEWQKRRLIQYLLGEVQLPPVQNTRRNSDRDLRTLARRAADGDDMAAVALLRAQVRAGLLSQERLDMAARLGDEAAREAGGVGKPLDWTSIQDRTDTLSLLSRKTMTELACKWAESSLYVWESRYPDDLRPRIAIEAARKWINNPTLELAQVAYQESQNSVSASHGLLGIPAWHAARSAADAARVPAAALVANERFNSAAYDSAMAAGDAASAISMKQAISMKYRRSSTRNQILESQIPDVIRALLAPDMPSQPSTI